MHREKLLNLLYLFEPEFEYEKKNKEEIIDFVKENPKCFDRNFEPGHITASAIVVDQTKKHILLHFHKKLKKWIQFGGHADGENDIINVASREVFEESGLKSVHLVNEVPFTLFIHIFPEMNGFPEHKHFDIQFLFEGDINEVPNIAEQESNKTKWIRFDDILKYNDETTMVELRKKLQHEQTSSSTI